MKRILIVGSASGNLIEGDWDVVYCANSAISRLSSDYDKKIIHVASKNMFIKPEKLAKESGLKAECLKARFAVLNNRTPKVLITFGNAVGCKDIEIISEEVAYNPTQTKDYSISEYHKIIRAELGMKPYLLSLILKKGRVRNALRLFNAFYRERGVSHYFKPSTGVFAVIMATKEYGDSARYYFSGISLSREVAIYNGLKMKYSTTGHMPFDKIALGLIESKKDITYID